MAVEQQSVIAEAKSETLLEPQLREGQCLFISEKGQDRGEAYGLQERDGITVYASLKIIGDHFRLHLIVWNQREEEIAWDKETVLLSSKNGEPFPFRLVGEGFFDGRIQPGETGGGKMYFWYASSSEPVAILTLSLEQEKLSFRFGLPSADSKKLTRQQRMFEAWMRNKQLPSALFRTIEDLCSPRRCEANPNRATSPFAPARKIKQCHSRGRGLHVGASGCREHRSLATTKAQHTLGKGSRGSDGVQKGVVCFASRLQTSAAAA